LTWKTPKPSCGISTPLLSRMVGTDAMRVLLAGFGGAATRSRAIGPRLALPAARRLNRRCPAEK
jgi:hypothetical protein